MRVTTYGTKSVSLWLGKMFSKVFRSKQGFIPLCMDSCLQKDLKRKGLLM